MPSQHVQSSSPLHDSDILTPTSSQQPTCEYPSVDIAMVGRMPSRVSDSERIELEPTTETPVEEAFQQETNTGTSEMLLPQSTSHKARTNSDIFVTGMD